MKNNNDLQSFRLIITMLRPTVFVDRQQQMTLHPSTEPQIATPPATTEAIAIMSAIFPICVSHTESQAQLCFIPCLQEEAYVKHMHEAHIKHT